MAGHGGGAWKVAFADFMTALMALFLVLWISAQDKKILIATSRYFQSPFRSPMEDHSGLMPFNKDSAESSKQDSESSGQKKPSDRERQIELNFLNSVAADFARLLNLEQNVDKKPIEVEVTSDGLRITLFDRAKKPLFVGDTAEFSEWGNFVMQNLAWMIDRHHFLVTIDGHTRSGLPTRPGYSAWELSTDRANASRRKLVHYAVDPSLIERVTGYADTQSLPGEPPTSDSNQRVTLSLRLGTRSADRKPDAQPRPSP
ncbi:MAG TPA: flagellar motor protein MotB [Opitutus sp.]|nr:flagellar motor protein MotB [Opitutus sp.]